MLTDEQLEKKVIELERLEKTCESIEEWSRFALLIEQARTELARRQHAAR